MLPPCSKKLENAQSSTLSNGWAKNSSKLKSVMAADARRNSGNYWPTASWLHPLLVASADCWSPVFLWCYIHTHSPDCLHVWANLLEPKKNGMRKRLVIMMCSGLQLQAQVTMIQQILRELWICSFVWDKQKWVSTCGRGCWGFGRPWWTSCTFWGTSVASMKSCNPTKSPYHPT